MYPETNYLLHVFLIPIRVADVVSQSTSPLPNKKVGNKQKNKTSKKTKNRRYGKVRKGADLVRSSRRPGTLRYGRKGVNTGQNRGFGRVPVRSGTVGRYGPVRFGTVWYGVGSVAFRQSKAYVF